MENKVTKEQLKKIKDFQLKMNNKLRDLGFIENQKHILLHEYAGINQESDEYKKELEKDYGAIRALSGQSLFPNPSLTHP